MRRLIALACSMAILGVGCAHSGPPPSSSGPSGIPLLRVETPANGSETTLASVDIVGRTDVGRIIVDGSSHDVTDGRFMVPVSLVVGTNMIALIAGNGLSTTTQSLRIERFNTQ
ncbi:hypothetical protein KJ925_01170 [Patescibacteria group bacterium]|nr:hypothetical protein [Patescibacteria group bacterium]